MNKNKSQNFITLANELDTHISELPVKKEILIKLCYYLAQYECIRNKIFTESDTFDSGFILYVQEPMQTDVDAIKVLSLLLARHREVAVLPGQYNPNANIAKIFTIIPNLSHRSVQNNKEWTDLYWFENSEQGTVFLNLFKTNPELLLDSGTDSNIFKSDPKADAARAIYSFLPIIQTKLQYLIDTLGVLHNVTESIENAKKIKLHEHVSAESVRNLRELPFIRKLIKVHFLLFDYVRKELYFRLNFASGVLTVASSAALYKGTINSDIVNACKNQVRIMEEIFKIMDMTEDDEKNLFYSITHMEEYEAVARAEINLLKHVQSLIQKCDKISTLSATLRLPNISVWPPELASQGKRCLDAIQSFVNISSQVGINKDEILLSGGNTIQDSSCTTIRNLTWLGKSNHVSECEEKINSLYSKNWSGAGIIFLINDSCLHMTELDKKTIAPRWIGGKKDAEDKNWLDTAIRETNEETYFLAKGPSNKTELKNMILEYALKQPHKVFVAETTDPKKYNNKPPYILLILNIAPTSIFEERIKEFVSEYSIDKIPKNSPSIYFEQGSFMLLQVNKLPVHLQFILSHQILKLNLKLI